MTRRITATTASRLALAALLTTGGHSAHAADAPAALPVALTADDSSFLASDDGVSGGAVPAGPAFSGLAEPLPVARPAPEPVAPAPAPAPVVVAAAAPVPVAPAPAPAPLPAPEPAPVMAAGPAAPTPPPAPLEASREDLAPPAEAAPVAPPAPAPGDVESLRDAIIASLKNNPDIQIALAQQDDAHAAIGEARAGYMPHLDVTVGYGPEIARPNATTGTTRRNRVEGSVTLTQNIWDWGVTINDIRRARASYRAAQWATREQIEAISFDITSAYSAMLQQQHLIQLTEDEIEATKKILRMITVQKELGLTTQADVDRAKARAENLQSTLLDRRSALQQARDDYKRLTNHVPGLAVDLPSTPNALPATVEEAIDLIDDHSPRMAQAVEDRRSLDRQYASQTGTFLPRFGVMVQANHKYNVLGATGLSEDGRAMVTMSYSFLNGGADVALRNRIAARLRQADYELDRRRREVEQDIRADFQSLGAARQKIATINAEIESAQRVSDLYKQQFREGKRSVFDLLDSQQVLFNARANAVANEIAMHLAEYRVMQKLGGLFDFVSVGEPLPPLVVPAPVHGRGAPVVGPPAP